MSTVLSDTQIATVAPARRGQGASSPEGLFDDGGSYLPPSDVEGVKRAYAFAAEAHAGQLRESGEPYINHPLAVAETLARLHLDTATDRRCPVPRRLRGL